MTNRKYMQIGVSTLGLIFLAQSASAGEGLKWGGDLRYRHESVSAGDASPYQQHRIRARLSANAQVNSNTSTEFRLATANGRTSTNQTLGASANAFGNYTITLDRANFMWNPNQYFNLSGGRIANPYFNAGGSDLVFDNDVNFDGLNAALNYSTDEYKIFFNTNLFWLDKSTVASVKDVMLISDQLGFRHNVNENINWTVGFALLHYTHMAGHAALGSNAGGNSTDTVGTTSVYANDFNLLNPSLEFGFKAAEIPFKIYTDMVRNPSAKTGKNAYLVGLKIGALKDAGSWCLGYDYRRLDKNAVVAALTDADNLIGSGTDGRSHAISGGYQLAEGWSARLSGKIGKYGISNSATEVRRNKLQADLEFKF